MITDIASIDHFNKIIRQDNVSVIDYHASWSAPSEAMLPKLSALAKTHPKINFYKLDVDEHTQLTQDAGARIYPTFVVYQRGTKLKTVPGANPDGLMKAIQDALAL